MTSNIHHLSKINFLSGLTENKFILGDNRMKENKYLAKALMEPTFCEMYAKFYVQLASGLPESYEDNEKVVFKRVLLNKCQEEFERDEREQAEAEQAEEHGEGKLSAEERREKKAAAR